MKYWVVFSFVVLMASVLAACDDVAREAEAKYTTGNYSDFARLGEAYENAALCFNNEGDYEKAEYYYTLAGNAYSSAANGLTQDFGIKAALYNAAGDAFAKAKLSLLAIENYNKTIALFNAHPDQVDSNKMQHALQKTKELQNPSMKVILNTQAPKGELSVIFILILVLLVVGFLSLFVYSRARK